MLRDKEDYFRAFIIYLSGRSKEVISSYTYYYLFRRSIVHQKNIQYLSITRDLPHDRKCTDEIRNGYYDEEKFKKHFP